MTFLDVLIELLERIAANGGAKVLISEDELRQWPIESVQAMKKQKLIARARPATSAICPGCEEACVMPVNTLPGEKGASASFIVCDKRNDINRVALSPEKLTQWQSDPDLLCGFIAANLGIRRSKKRSANIGFMEIGMASGNKRNRMLCLRIDDELNLVTGDSVLPLAEAVDFKADGYFLDEVMIRNLVDSAKTADDRYTPSNARREVRKLDTQAMYESWQREYLNLKKSRPGMSNVWYSRQIAKMDIAQGRDSETIRKNMKK